MKNFKLSNKAHIRLAELNNDKANKANLVCGGFDDRLAGAKRNFVSIVKRDYHRECVKEQTRLGRVLTESEKKNLYKQSHDFTVEYRKKVGLEYFSSARRY